MTSLTNLNKSGRRRFFAFVAAGFTLVWLFFAATISPLAYEIDTFYNKHSLSGAMSRLSLLVGSRLFAPHSPQTATPHYLPTPPQTTHSQLLTPPPQTATPQNSPLLPNAAANEPAKKCSSFLSALKGGFCLENASFSAIYLVFANKNNASKFSNSVFANSPSVTAATHFGASNLRFKDAFLEDFAFKWFFFRLPMLLFAFANAFLLVRVGKFYLKRANDDLLCLLIWLALPFNLAAAVILNEASLVIFTTLLAVLFYERKKPFYLALTLLAALFLTQALPLCLALFLFGLYARDNTTALIGLFALLVSLYSADIASLVIFKQSYLLQTLLVFALSFSPLVFFWFIYGIYRIGVQQKRRLLWFVAFCSFFICVFVSIRQKPNYAVFLAYSVLLVVMMTQTFLASYRIRLPIFRRFHRGVAWLLAFSLVLNLVFAFVLNPFLKAFDPKLYTTFYAVKPFAKELKNRGFTTLCGSDKLAYQLSFYGITHEAKEPLRRVSLSVDGVTHSFGLCR